MEKKRRRRLALTLGTVLALGTAAGTIWVSNAASARAEVEVLIGPDAIKCQRPQDATVFKYEFGSSDEISIPVPGVRLNDGLDCTFSFIVTNTSDAEVSLKGLKIDMMGANAGGAHMPRLMHNNIERITNESADASFRLNQSLNAGDTVRISAVIERIPGCMTSDVATITSQTPEVKISAYGLGGTIAPQGPAFAVVGTPDSTCDT